MKPYLAAADLLRKRIRAGVWAPGQRIASQNALAEELGIAVATVQKSLKEIERDGLIRSEHGRGRFVTDPATDHRTWTVGVVMFDLKHIGHPAAGQRLMGIKDVIEPAGYSLSVFAMNNGSAMGVDRWVQRVGKSHVDGLIIVAQEPDMETVRELSGMMPNVWMDGPAVSERSANVNLDYLGGGFAAAQHLIQMGHMRLMFAGPSPQDYRIVQQQHAGVNLAVEQLGDAGVSLQHGLVEGFSAAAAKRMFVECLATPGSRPSAVICASDEIAQGALKACLELGLRIPRDLSLVAWNDTIAPDESPVPLTTVRMDFRQTGAVSARLLINLIEGLNPASHEERLAAKFIVRQSTAPVPVSRRLRRSGKRMNVAAMAP